ncbi:MAG: hypothetical protein ABR987_22405 [Terracidiphilus sp.]
MSARQDILNGKFKGSPAGLAALRAAGGTGETADLFAGFVAYASAHWNYAAQPGPQKAQELLDGDGPKTVACGTLRDAIKIMMREDLHLTVRDTENQRFLTKPALKCFDSKVKGKVGNHGSTQFDLACYFSAHYFVETGGRFYDPCLMSVYDTSEGPIAHKTRLVIGSDDLRKAGTGKAMVFLRVLPGRTVPGFGEVREILVPAECKVKGLLSPKDYQAFKTDPDVIAAKLL